MKPDQLYAHISAKSCNALWCTVLATAWNDAVYPPRWAHPGDVARARQWFGSKDFWRVCALADADGEKIMRRFESAVSSGQPRSGLCRKRIAA